jgi:hypothetical protein
VPLQIVVSHQRALIRSVVSYIDSVVAEGIAVWISEIQPIKGPTSSPITNGARSWVRPFALVPTWWCTVTYRLHDVG